jgi:hypothetical protein
MTFFHPEPICHCNTTAEPYSGKRPDCPRRGEQENVKKEDSGRDDVEANVCVKGKRGREVWNDEFGVDLRGVSDAFGEMADLQRGDPSIEY